METPTTEQPESRGANATWNDKPKPFVWKATADVILDKVRRCREATAKS